MKRRRRHTGCTIEAHKGNLRLRFRWQGRRYSRATALPDNADNRAQLQKLANLIAATIAADKDPLVLLKPKTEASTSKPNAMTVNDYFAIWIADKVPPVVRKAQARDYRRHVESYILPKLGKTAIAQVTPRDILGLRAELLQRGLSLKYVKNILGGSFKALMRDAREIDQLFTHDPFVGVRWGRVPVPGPEPFSSDERRAILRWFEERPFAFRAPGTSTCTRKRRHPPYHAYVHTLFWTGMRPSEVSGLRWGDIDLENDIVRVIRSRHMWEDSAPKTGPAARTVELLPESVRLIKAIQPLHVTPEMPVFTNVAGGPIEPNSLLRHWYPCLRAEGIRVRGLYAMKDTYISTALTAGVNTMWLEAQTGVRYETMKRHYGKWLRLEGANQLRKIALSAGQLAPQLAPQDFAEPQDIEIAEEEECERGDLNPGRPGRKPWEFKGSRSIGLPETWWKRPLGAVGVELGFAILPRGTRSAFASSPPRYPHYHDVNSLNCETKPKFSKT